MKIGIVFKHADRWVTRLEGSTLHELDINGRPPFAEGTRFEVQAVTVDGVAMFAEDMRRFLVRGTSNILTFAPGQDAPKYGFTYRTTHHHRLHMEGRIVQDADVDPLILPVTLRCNENDALAELLVDTIDLRTVRRLVNARSA